MSGWSIFFIILVVLAVLLIAMNAKDIYRYIKMNRM